MTVYRMGQIVKRLQKRFNLQGWRVEVQHYCGPDEAEIEYEMGSRSAVISVNREVPDADLPEVIIHEMLHLVLAAMMNRVRNIVKDPVLVEILEQEEEQAVISLTQGWNRFDEKAARYAAVTALRESRVAEQVVDESGFTPEVLDTIAAFGGI